MKSNRRCNDCGSEMVCYTSVISKGVRKQFFKCSDARCDLRLKIGQKIIYEQVKRKGEKLFRESTTTTVDATNSAS